jgi:hypothetical protein
MVFILNLSFVCDTKVKINYMFEHIIILKN